MTGRKGAPTSLGTILRGMDIVPGNRSIRDRERLEEAWAASAGPQIARASRPESLRAGTLTVLVRGSAWLQELRGFRGETIRTALAASLGKAVDRIRYRLESSGNPRDEGGA